MADVDPRSSPDGAWIASGSFARPVLSADRIARPDLMSFAILGALLLAPLLSRRFRLRPAPLRHLRLALRRYRRRLRHDLGALAVLPHGRPRRLGGRRTRGQRRARPHPSRRKPAEGEVRRQWDEATAEARSRWDTLRAQI